MLYRNDKYGNKISILGHGCMRFSKKGPSIDYKKAEEEVLLAISKGVNYFDTAYIYPGSEEILGRILGENNLRKDVFIATKLPQYIVKSRAGIDKIFNEELKRLRTDYIDYYLMHMITDINQWEKLLKIGIEDFINEKKKSGAIRNIGFSFHGNQDMFIKVLEAYPWDFCQIQYNYLDEHSQAGRAGLRRAHELGIPVIIMEPLRGGKLVNMLPKKALSLIKNSPRNYSAAEWALKWLWNQEEVTCVLSGMNSIDMVEENCRIASNTLPNSFTEEDEKLISSIVSIIKEKEKVGCTACRYCMPCPMGVDIPGTFYFYNLMQIENKGSARFGYYQNLGLSKESSFATKCISCGKCMKHCPQSLQIPELIKEADKALMPPHYRLFLKIYKRFTN